MEELDLIDIFKMFWNKKFAIIFIVAICGAVGYVYSTYFVEPVYTSYTTMVLVQAESPTGTEGAITANDLTINQRLVSTYSELIRSRSVIRTVLENLGLERELDETSVARSIRVTAVRNTEVIEIAVTNPNPAYSVLIANEIADVFSEKVSEIYNINNITIVDKAELSSAPSNVNDIRTIAIFAIVGVAIAAAYVVIANMLDVTIKSTEDIENLTKLPVLTSIQVINMKKAG